MNSIQMVKIQPAVNFLKVNHYGDMDTIADKQAELYKKYNYRPLLSLIPLAAQIVLLLGVVQIIYHPLDYLFSIDPAAIAAMAEQFGLNTEDSSYQLQLIELINPKIIAYSGEQDGQEGCLSVPGRWGMVKRPMHVTVRALNRKGEEFEITGHELLARCFCHELDHLDGIIFTEVMERYLTDEELDYEED